MPLILLDPGTIERDRAEQVIHPALTLRLWQLVLLLLCTILWRQANYRLVTDIVKGIGGTMYLGSLSK